MRRALKRFTRIVIKPNFMECLRQYPKYFSDWIKYKKLEGAEPIKLKDCYPCLFDNTGHFSPANHYYYQDIWGLKHVYRSKVDVHVDIGSKAEYVGFLTAFTKVEFVDIRPLDVPYLKNFKNIKGSILQMPYEDSSVKSMSCLHVAEHIGLGRYGESLDYDGDLKAIGELKRVLGKDGNLLFVVPVGEPRIRFNAHRIYSYGQIIDYFSDYKLKEFSLIPDNGINGLVENASPMSASAQKYGCGCFWFTR